MRPDAPADPLQAARAILARLRGSAQDRVVSVESVESPRVDRLSTLSTLTTHAVATPDDGTDAEQEPRAVVNRGVLITVAMRHGYPRLPLKPGVAVADGYAAWRTFARDADAEWLGLAAEAARTAWGDDPMIRDLMYFEAMGLPTADDSENARDGCSSGSRPCPEMNGPIHGACRDNERGQRPEDC